MVRVGGKQGWGEGEEVGRGGEEGGEYEAQGAGSIAPDFS